MDFRNKLLHASERVDRAVQQRRASAQAIAGRGTNALIALHSLLAERSNGSSDYKYHDLTDEVKMAHAVHRQYKPVQLLQSSGSARTQHAHVTATGKRCSCLRIALPRHPALLPTGSTRSISWRSGRTAACTG